MIELRVVEDAQLGLWADLKTRVVPNEPVTEEQLRAADEPDRLLLLAELDGALAGCGIADRSNFGGRAFIAARVLPELRRRGRRVGAGRCSGPPRPCARAERRERLRLRG